MLECKSDQLKEGHGKFLIDTGANVSIISSEVLVPNVKIMNRNRVVRVRSSTDHLFPIEGSVVVSLQDKQGQALPRFNFLVTNQSCQALGGCDGVIGMDILCALRATVDCQNQCLKRDQHPIPIPLFFHAPTKYSPQLFRVKVQLNGQLKRKAVQVLAGEDYFIPPRTQVIAYGCMPWSPFRNLPHETLPNVLRSDGVLVGGAVVHIEEDGRFPLPFLNLSNQPYPLRARDLLTMAKPFLAGGESMVVGASDGRAEEASEGSEPGEVSRRNSPEPSSANVGARGDTESDHVPELPSDPEADQPILTQSSPTKEDVEMQEISDLAPQSADSATHSGEDQPTGQIPPGHSQKGEKEPGEAGPSDTQQEEMIPTGQEAPSEKEKMPPSLLQAVGGSGSFEKFYQHFEPIVQELEELLPPVRSPMTRDGITDNVSVTYVTGEADYETLGCSCQQWHTSGATCPKYRRQQGRARAQVMTIKAMQDITLMQHLQEAAKRNRLSPADQGKLEEMLTEFSDIFRREGNKTHTCPLFEQSIPLNSDKPVCVPQYPLPRAARDAVKERVQEFLDAGIIKPSKSGYNSPVWMVPKKDGKWRLCVDFREVNKLMIHDPFPLPKIDEMVEEFHGSEYLSTGDLFWGFYHVKVKEEDTHKLAFTTDVGRFEFIHMPMGLKIAPAVFQRLMNLVLDDYLRKFVLVYMDDVVVYSKDKEQHFHDLRKVFERLREAGLRLKIEKCAFFQTELPFLGVIISKTGIRLDPSKVEAVVKFPKPDKDLGQLQSFLGLVGYFKRHIKNYAAIARPLFDLMKGEETHKKKQKGKVRTPFKKNEWGPAQDEAFAALKEAATTAPVLSYPNFDIPFILTTDASAYAIGFVLSQEFPDGEHPIAYGSRSLKGAELNYSNTDREMLAVVKGVEHFRTYLYGRHFIIRTDHQAIALINRGKPTSSRVLKWILDMKDYSFEVVYTPATKIRHADALSRVRYEEVAEKHEAEHVDPPEQVFHLWGEPRSWEPILEPLDWVEEQKADDQLQPLYQRALQGDQSTYKIYQGVLHQLIDGTHVPLVPQRHRSRIIKQFHGPPAQGHLGPERTYLTMRRYVYWPSMRNDVTEFVKKCEACQRNKRSYIRIPLQPQCIPPRLFHTVTMDVVGPVPPSLYQERYILVVQDLLTRWVEFAPMRQTDTPTIINHFMTVWITRYGVPERVLTDRGSNFVGELARAFYQAFGIPKANTTAYRPQGNGANERMHQELTKFFSIYLEDHSRTRWRFLLNDARYAYNTAYHTALKMSPYEAVFGMRPSMGPLGIPQTEEEFDRQDQFYGMRRRVMMQKRQMIQENLQRAQERALKHQNAHAHRIPFHVDDLVLLRNHHPRDRWDQKYLGPWKVVNRLSPVVFDIEKDGRRKLVHAAHLKLYIPSEDDEMSQGVVPIRSHESYEMEEEPEEVRHENFVEITDEPAMTGPPDPPDEEDTAQDPADEQEQGNYMQATRHNIPKAADRFRGLLRQLRVRARRVELPNGTRAQGRSNRTRRPPQRLGEWTA